MINYQGPSQPADGSKPIDMDAVFRLMQDASRFHNSKPDPEMGGLSPEQVMRLYVTPWGIPGAPLQLNANMTLSECERSTFFRNMRTFLCAVRDAGKVKVTSSRSLNRQFVADMMSVLLAEEHQALIRQMRKNINEEHVPGLNLIRGVAEIAGLIRLSKGAFSVPKTKWPLLAPDRAGELFRNLFVTFFVNLDLAYISGAELKAASLQAYLSYTLYRLGVVANDWHAIDTLPIKILLPQVKLEVESELMKSRYWTMEELLVNRILTPLINWGLLEGRKEKVENHYFPSLVAVRVTPLYRDFLHVRFE